MDLKKNKKKCFIVLFSIFFILTLNSLLLNLNYNSYSKTNDESSNKNHYFDDDRLETQDLLYNNIYSGIGAPWNVTQWANRTDYDLSGSFNEGSYDLIEIPLEMGWEGYRLDSDIRNLYDSRNWNNGTFAFGSSDAVVAGHNDSARLPHIGDNTYQNWTFHSYDVGLSTNTMSGNYINSGGRDYLELYMRNGSRYIAGYWWWSYDNGDRCMWNSSFYIDRGKLINATLEFEVNPRHLVNFNTFTLAIYINNYKVFSKGTYEIKQMAGREDNWITISHPQAKWTNKYDVFSENLNNSLTTISIALESLGSNMRGFTNKDYQQLFIDNVRLITRAEVKPIQIGLKLNSTDVKTIDWGKGKLNKIAGDDKWLSYNNKAYVNFSCTDSWDLGDFTIDLKLVSNLYAVKNDLETTYETNQASIGTSFSVENDSSVKWVSFVYIQVPEDYIQKNINLQFPKDYNITGVFDPQFPSDNILSQCDSSARGLLNINISEISLTPDGFWKFEAISPNYCEDLDILVYQSGSWVKNDTIVSRDKINFRVNITLSNSYVDISNYIEYTSAQLQIRFPNGTMWIEQNRIANPDLNGIVNFSYFKVPSIISPNYIAGEYEAIVTWNNSYSTFGINESGIITRKFIIQHDSILEPKDDDYYIENIINGTITNIKVTYRDNIDNTYISGAEVYAKDPSESILVFSETSPGFYLLIFDTSSRSTGNITLRVFANSSYYHNKQINITVDVIEETILTVDNDFLTDIQYNQNFTIQFNYTRKNNPLNEILIGVENDFSTDWMADSHVVPNGDGTYNLTCNTTGYAPNVIHSFTFTVNTYKFESQTKKISVLINELDSKIEIFVNNTPFSTNDILNVEVWQKINITARYMDINNNIISDGIVRVIGREGLDKNLTYISQNDYYNIILNVTDLAEGIDYLNVLGESVNHKFSSIPFIVQITENKTLMEVYFNGVNVTADPNIELVFGSTLNITVRYTNILGVPLESASLRLSGDYSDNLLENITLKQYSVILDSLNLSIGVKIIKLTAEKNNFETQVEDLRIAVRKIKTDVSIEDGEDTIEIEPGESVTITIEVLDLDNNVRIRGAKVEYEWKLKDGEFDEESNGLYEVKLKDIPEGTYTITITVSKAGEEYDFETLEIDLIVRAPQEETLMFQILLIIAIIVAGALVAYIIYYQKVLKYPKPIRKVRKFRRSLKKKKAPRVDIINREKAFNQLYDQQLKNISRPLKSKISEGKPISNKIKKKSEASKPSEKIVKKLPNKGSNKEINNTPKNSSNVKTDKLKENQPKSENSKKTNEIYNNKDRNSFESPLNKKFKIKKLQIKKKYSNRLQFKRKKKLFFLSLILMFLILNSFIVNLKNNQDIYNKVHKSSNGNDSQNYELKSQSLDFYDNNFNNSGVGGAWNITHYANNTDSGVASFGNNSYQILSVQSASGWTGYRLNASVRNLYDKRQWVNGTMHFGANDTYAPGDDDSAQTTGWDFYTVGAEDNPMSGNYLDTSAPLSRGHDCLELRMNGQPGTGIGGQRYSYDENDRCWWETYITVPRGQVIDSTFRFDVSPKHLSQVNSWEVIIYINDYEIYSLDIIALRDIGFDNWQNLELPQEIWTNDDVLDSPIYGTSTKIEIELAYTSTGASYGVEDGPNIDYQQVLFDNVELEIKAEAQPSQVNLKMNNTDILNENYGYGEYILKGSWNGTENPFLPVNFSSQGSGTYGSYEIEFNADLNLYAKKETPDTYYETDTNSPGTYFTVANDSSVYWEAFGYITTPTGYDHTEMTVEYPTDVDIMWVSSPQQPGSNELSECDDTINGLLKIPTSLITNPSKPDGFWKLLGTSPNYCEQLTIYRNGTENPLDNVWNQETIFFIGDYINITAKITDYPEISDHITSTNAILQIRFPNGSIWQSINQLGTIDSNGNVYFNYFMIPPNPPDYQAGVYEAIITWNNSHSNRGLNETGLIYKEFTVIHDSILEPDDGNFFIEDIIDEGIVNIKVSFRDKEDNTAISNAHVYTKNATDIIDFSETSPGLYLYEFDRTYTKAGHNNISIYANSTYHLNKEINITLDITKQTVLTVDNTYLSVPSNENFSITFNYTELNSPETGIDEAELSTNWIDHTFSTISQGYYNLTCNTSAYEANKLHTLILTVKKYRYEPQSIAIRVYVSELGSSISLLVNDTAYSPNDIYTTEVWQDINITVRYEDSFGNHLSGANVTLLGKGKMEENIYDQYTIIINASSLAEDIDTLTIFANKSQYNPQTTQFIVEITERKTNIEIWLNGLNKTKDPFIELPIGKVLNLRINYTDSATKHVEDATVRLSGEGLNILLSEDKVEGIYATTINTVTLNLGTKVLSIDASKNNYEPIVKNIRTNIRKIRTKVTTDDGDKHYDIRPYENFKLTIEVKDLDFGGYIEDADVTYSWEFGDGDLKEVDDGIYEITFENVPEGSYTIEISVFKEGGEYDFEDLEITLTARRPEGESFLFLVLFIIAAAVTVSLASYYVYYRKVLRYPKPVRKVRKYRRSLKKKSAPSIDIIDREKGFKKVYSEELGKTSKSLKSKMAEETLVMEKIKKKSITLPKNKPEK